MNKHIDEYQPKNLTQQ